MNRFKALTVAAVAISVVSVTAACAPAVGPDENRSTPSFEDEAEALAESLGIESPPEVQRIRTITLAEWGPTMVQCLNEAGWDARATDDGDGVRYPTVTEPGMNESLSIAIYTCEVQYPVDPKYTMPLSESQLRALYDYRSNELVKCLQAEGYDLEANAPSMSVFLESGGAWSPYDGISLSRIDAARINEVCPQVPEGFWG